MAIKVKVGLIGALDMLKFIGARVYRTDLQGTIICTSDGENITWQTERTTEDNLFKAP